MPTNIACWGDSLTAGSGAGAGEDYPSVLATLLSRTVYNGGVPGENAAQITARVAADSAHRNDVVIFWMGTNDDSSTGTAIKAKIAESVASLAGNTKYLVLAVTTRVAEVRGTTGNTQRKATNNELSIIYGAHYFDVREFIIHRYNPATESAFHLTDRPPDSMVADTVHFNAAGYAAVAGRLAQIITELEW